mmetsp:Transcript_8121/g.10139  ORF Transcript_8121/g.10139 Transcript_8121/m.10139 type:complete len:260 (-) Transcript_8121:410-1189(-)
MLIPSIQLTILILKRRQHNRTLILGTMWSDVNDSFIINGQSLTSKKFGPIDTVFVVADFSVAGAPVGVAAVVFGIGIVTVCIILKSSFPHSHSGIIITSAIISSNTIITSTCSIISTFFTIFVILIIQISHVVILIASILAIIIIIRIIIIVVIILVLRIVVAHVVIPTNTCLTILTVPFKFFCSVLTNDIEPIIEGDHIFSVIVHAAVFFHVAFFFLLFFLTVIFIIVIIIISIITTVTTTTTASTTAISISAMIGRT